MVSEKTETLISLKNSVDFDLNNKTSTSAAMDDTKGPQTVLYKYAIKDHSNLIKTFPVFVQNNAKKIIESEEQNIGQHQDITGRQLKECLIHIKFIQEFNWPINEIPHRWHTVAVSRSSSIFETLLSLYKAIKVQISTIFVNCDEKKRYIGDILSELFELSSKNDDDEELQLTEYCSQVIFDTGDISSAFHQLDMAIELKTSPWRIRSCWIQESLRDIFSERFGSRSDLVVGSRKHLTNTDAIVVVNFFRTVKEAVTLINADADAVCASIWTENVSIALEVANRVRMSNVWINSNGITHPRVPFTFNDEEIFGSELIQLFQTYAHQSKKDLSSMDKDDYKAALTESYSLVVTEKNKTFFVSSEPRSSGDRQILSLPLKDVLEPTHRNLLANLAENKFKTICMPFGSIFAN